jgi:AraC-like DNA-binding protein
MRITHKEADILGHVKEYLESHPQQKFPIADLCREFNINRTKLIKGFKLLYGVTVYTYQLSVSMNYALHLIRNGAQVKELAFDLDYSSSSSFTRAFRKIHNNPPEYYRFLLQTDTFGV